MTNPFDSPIDWIVSLTPALARSITLLEVSNPAVPIVMARRSEIIPSFNVQTPANGRSDFLLEVEMAGRHAYALRIWTEDAFQEYATGIDRSLNMLLGCVIATCLFELGLFLALGDSSCILYGGFFLVSMARFALDRGYLNALPDYWHEMNLTVNYGIRFALGLLILEIFVRTIPRVWGGFRVKQLARIAQTAVIASFAIIIVEQSTWSITPIQIFFGATVWPLMAISSSAAFFIAAFNGKPGARQNILHAIAIMLALPLGQVSSLAAIGIMNPEHYVLTRYLPACLILMIVFFCGSQVADIRQLLIDKLEAELEKQASAQQYASKLEQAVERRTRLFYLESDLAYRLAESRSETLDIVAHDIKSPLNGIMLATERLHKRLDGEHRNSIGIINMALNTIRNRLDLLLRVGPAENFVIPVKPDWVNLQEVIQKECDMLAERANSRNIAIHNRVAAGEKWYLDVIVVCAVIGNLIDNSVKYGNYGTQVTVSASNHGIIRVEDNGPGLPPHIARAPFSWRLPNNGENNVFRSQGLGLRACHTLITAHGGEIRYIGEMTGGAAFEIDLGDTVTTAFQPEGAA